MKTLVLFFSLLNLTNSFTLEDIVRDYNWRVNTSRELKQLFSQTELVDLNYLSDNSIEPMVC